MTTTWTRSLKRWISIRVFKQPVQWTPRSDCHHHAAGCYLCPRTHCIGELNDLHDADLTKPRTATSIRSVTMQTTIGSIRLVMSKGNANAHYARKAAEGGEQPIEMHELTVAEIAELERYWFFSLFNKLGD